MYRIFIPLVGISIAIDVVLGAWASTAWESFARFFFVDPAPLDAGSRLIGLVLGIALFFFAALQAFGLWRIRREDGTGYLILIAFSGYLVVSAVLTLVAAQVMGPLKFGGFEFLLVDGLRGALLGTFAVLAMREPATVRELKLPSAAERARMRPPRERGEEPRRRSRSVGAEHSRSSERRRSGPPRGTGDRGGRGGRRRRRSSGGRSGDRSGSPVSAA